jgi:aryl-alcohol dehydrogenase-like predicted oxidoreductase
MAKHDEPGCETEVFATIAQIRTIADEVGATMAEVALAWVQKQPGVTALLVGARNPEEVQWNLPSVDLTLPNDIIERLSATTETVKNKLGNNPDMWMSESRMR